MKNYYTKGLIEAGCDEAGRGCLAGPVVAAAVILPDKFRHPLLDDSKKMSEKNRALLEPIIKDQALAFAIGVVDSQTIDQINILNASFLAMHRAIDQLVKIPELLLIDGNRFKKYKDLNHHCIIKGDGKYKSIAAASVLAKVERDRIMDKLNEEYPDYLWSKNKGYPTTDHRKAIEKLGTTPYHRLTFTLLADSQMKLDF
ncbi:MAG: ribonuclease HII [Crocinitomicaceae bacterium]|nr:ribonuclease HII [Crocinitomicaceae bacterium]